MDVVVFPNSSNVSSYVGNISEHRSYQMANMNDDVTALRAKLNIAQSFISPALLIVGLVGNLFTILTVSKQQFRRLISRYLLCALAISDSLLLLTNIFNQHFVIEHLSMDLRALSDVGCKLFFVFYRHGKITASWFIVAIASERFCAVLFPLKVRSILTKRTLLFVIFVIHSSILCFASNWTFSTNIVNGTCKPDTTTPDKLVLHKYFVIAGAIAYSLAPICILSALTPPIVFKLMKHLRKRETLGQTFVSRSMRNVSRASIMLVAVVISYVICVMPITLILLLTFWTHEPIFETKNKHYMVFLLIAQTFEQINHSSNFIVYIMCGRQFRDGFLRMVGCKRRTEDDYPNRTTMMSDLSVASHGCYLFVND